jgi:alanine-synthesizing transaminase
MQIAMIMSLRQVRSADEAHAMEYQGRVMCCAMASSRIGDITRHGRACFCGQKFRNRAHMGSLDFSMKLLEEADVVVSPGAGFGPAGEGYLRIALVENEFRIRQAVRNIARCLGSESKTANSLPASLGPASAGRSSATVESTAVSPPGKARG